MRVAYENRVSPLGWVMDPCWDRGNGVGESLAIRRRQPQVTLGRTRLTCFIYAYKLCISNEPKGAQDPMPTSLHPLVFPFLRSRTASRANGN